MSALDEVKGLAMHCSFSRRMPARAVQLATATSELDDYGRTQIQRFILRQGLPCRMARRAVQMAPVNLPGAVSIIGALESLLGKEKTLEILHEADYDRRLIDCAVRFGRPKNNRRRLALQLLEHVETIFGATPELGELLKDSRTAEERKQTARSAVAVPTAI